MSQPPPQIIPSGPPRHMSIPPSTGGPPQRFPNPHGHFDDSSNKPPFVVLSKLIFKWVI
jgi:hypothetical protein